MRSQEFKVLPTQIQEDSFGKGQSLGRLNFSSSTEGERPVRVRRVLWQVLVVNLMVALLKGFAGAISGSAALLADAVHSAFDAANNVLGLAAMGVAARPPDVDHPYGHHKAEVAAALFIGVGIIYAAIEIGRHVVSGIFAGVTPELNGWVWAAAGIGLVLSFCLSRYEGRRGEELDSELLRADARDTACDVWTTLAAMAGMGLSSLGFAFADLLAAAIVMGMVAWTGYTTVRRGVDVLMDQSRLDADEVRQVVSQVSGVLSCHDIRSRGMQGHVHLDLHVTFCPETTLAEAGERMLVIKHLLREQFEEICDIVVQLEPHLPRHLPLEEEFRRHPQLVAGSNHDPFALYPVHR